MIYVYDLNEYGEPEALVSDLKPVATGFVKFTYTMIPSANEAVQDYKAFHEKELKAIERLGYERWYWSSLSQALFLV